MKSETWGTLFTEAANIAANLDHVKKKSNDITAGVVTGCDTMEALDIAKRKVKVYNMVNFSDVLEFMLGAMPNVWNDRHSTTKEMVVALFEKAAIVYKDV